MELPKQGPEGQGIKEEAPDQQTQPGLPDPHLGAAPGRDTFPSPEPGVQAASPTPTSPVPSSPETQPAGPMARGVTSALATASDRPIYDGYAEAPNFDNLPRIARKAINRALFAAMQGMTGAPGRAPSAWSC